MAWVPPQPRVETGEICLVPILHRESDETNAVFRERKWRHARFIYDLPISLPRPVVVAFRA